MQHEDDPLWYDRAELDEPANIVIYALAFAVVTAVAASKMWATLQKGAALAFRDVRS